MSITTNGAAMSLLDEVRGLETRVVDRIRELEDAVSELEDLRKVAKRLGLDMSPPRVTSAKRAHPARRRANARGAKRTAVRATRGATSGAKNGTSRRRDDVLRLVKDHPGTTVSEIGQRLGVDPTGLYRVVNKLQTEGAITRDAGKLRLA
jgi:transposase-like protein